MSAPTVVYVERGHEVDYTPGSDVVAGDVIVQGHLLAVATHDIPANILGQVAVDGVFDFPKSTGGGSGQAAGVLMFWDPGAKQATPTAGSGLEPIGKMVIASADADTTARIRLSNADRAAMRASAAQAAVATTGSTNSSPYGYTTSAQADAIVTLLNEIRTALVNAGIIKGGA